MHHGNKFGGCSTLEITLNRLLQYTLVKIIFFFNLMFSIDLEKRKIDFYIINGLGTYEQYFESSTNLKLYAPIKFVD